MTKGDYLAELRRRLYQLPTEELNQTVGFYAEMIDDRIEEGLTEEQAVSGMEPPEQLAQRILMDMPMGTLLKGQASRQAQAGKNNLPGWARALLIVLAVLACPIWLPIGIGLLAVVFAIFVVIWSVAIGIICAVAGVGVAAIVAVVCGIVLLTFNPVVGMSYLGCALLLTGLCVLCWFLVKWTVLGVIALTKAIWRGLKSLFISKEKKPAASSQPAPEQQKEAE